jgi:hypothetical protein
VIDPSFREPDSRRETPSPLDAVPARRRQAATPAPRIAPSPPRPKAPAPPTREALAVLYLLEDYRLSKKVAQICLPGVTPDALGEARLDEKAGIVAATAFPSSVRIRVPYIRDAALARRAKLGEVVRRAREEAEVDQRRARTQWEVAAGTREAYEAQVKEKLAEVEAEIRAKLETRLVLKSDEHGWFDAGSGMRFDPEAWRIAVEVVAAAEQIEPAIGRLAEARQWSGLNAVFVLLDCDITEAQASQAEAAGVHVLGLDRKFEAWAAQRLPSTRPARVDTI